MEAAGLAIKSLTHSELTPTSDSPSVSNSSSDLETRKQTFTKHTTEYFTLVKKIGEALQKQALALEEAGINVGDTQRTDLLAEVSNGWIGNLDVGLLNARMQDVGVAKEAELWEQAQEMLQNAKGNEEMKDA